MAVSRPTASAPSGHQAVDRALSILWLLRDRPGITAGDVAEELGVHKSTVSRLLAALQGQGLVDRTRDGRLRLGYGIARLAEGVSHQRDDAQVAQALCERTSAALELTSNVAILDGHHAVNIAQTEGGPGVLGMRRYIGLRTPGHATSSGKMLLAHADEDAVSACIADGLTPHTDATITTGEELREELAHVREQGWAASDQEWEQGVTAVAAPLRGVDGTITAALTVTAPQHLLPPESFEDVARELRRLALGGWG